MSDNILKCSVRLCFQSTRYIRHLGMHRFMRLAFEEVAKAQLQLHLFKLHIAIRFLCMLHL
ncbi:hypothetical protein MKX01_000455 [Papaver californicum]|nr:hypothetical protein MKX01_000455 [Papaver californicum]